MSTRALLAAALVSSGVALTACGGAKQTEPEAAAESYLNRVTERALPDGMVEQEVDLDVDGRADILNVFRERADAPRLLVRKELDLNRDGSVDVISFMDAEGKLEREEMDSDYDGIFDWKDHYQDGVRVMSEYDTDQDGRSNVFKYFIKDDDGVARLDRKERDEDGDGNIDVWERFNGDGEVVRTGRDTDGDGKMDVREE